MNIWSKKLLPDVAAVGLGALLTLAFAPFEIFPLAVIAPAGLLVLWLNASPKRAFWLGFLFGMGLFTAGTYWIFISIHRFGDVPTPIAAFLTGGLFAILALFPASAGFVMNRFFPVNQTIRILCVFPAVWILFSEWLRSWLFTGLAWLFIGYSQTNSPLKGYAPILGVYGVSLAVLLTSSLIVNSYFQYKQKKNRYVYFCLMAAASIWVIGSALNLISWTKPENKPMTVSLVQGNIPQSLKWSPDHLQLSFDRYVELTNPLWGKSELIIWPEAAIPLPLQYAENFIDSLDATARSHHSHIILGIPTESTASESMNEKEYHNAIVALGMDRSFYLKRQLVPFGEYIPFKNLVSGFFDILHIPMSNQIPGPLSQQPLQIGNIRILPSICFEITFPDLMRSFDPTIGLLLTVTNDAWFGESSAQAQHLQMAMMRALEFKRPVLFVSNDGITAIIGANGQIESQAPAHEAYVLNGSVQPRTGLTPWMYFGTDATLFILLCMLYVAIRARHQEKTAILNGSRVLPAAQENNN